MILFLKNFFVTPGRTKTRKKFHKKNKDILDGVRFVATPSAKTPLKYLEMHGAVAKIGEEIEPEDISYGIWVDQVKERYKIPGFEGELASPVGPIPTDGGTLIPLLKEVRKIIEQPFDSSNSLIVAMERADLIIQHVTTSDHPDLFHSNDECLELLINEYIGKIKHLNAKHYRELIDKECKSLNDISLLTENQIMELKGVGPAKAKSIRSSLSGTN